MNNGVCFDPEMPCPVCGMKHDCAVESVVIKPDAVKCVSKYLKGCQSALIVSDANTRPLYFDKLREALANAGVHFDEAYFACGDIIVPDEKAIAFIDGKVTESTELLIGIGSGVINDLCKYVSHSHSLPYMILATATSMDGYASKGCALILNGMKVTLNAAVPRWIIADTEILASAPTQMIQAGIGDIIGKWSSLSDWKLGALINGEVFCQSVYALTLQQVKAVVDNIDGCMSRSPESLGVLMKALVQVGFCMAYMANSRPASGSEHHLSHFFEITGILRQKPYYPHGIDVAFSSLMVAKLRRNALRLDPALFSATFDEAKFEKDMKNAFGDLSEEVIALQKRVGFHQRNICSDIQGKWDAICEILKEAANDEEQARLLLRIGLDADEFYRFYGKDTIREALLYAKELKDRYTVQWLLEDVGMLEKCIEI